jgi:hypothetical protein
MQTRNGNQNTYLLCWHVRVIIKVGPQFDPQLVLDVFAIRVQFGSCQQMLKVIIISGEKLGFIIDLTFSLVSDKLPTQFGELSFHY